MYVLFKKPGRVLFSLHLMNWRKLRFYNENWITKLIIISWNIAFFNLSKWVANKDLFDFVKNHRVSVVIVIYSFAIAMFIIWMDALWNTVYIIILYTLEYNRFEGTKYKIRDFLLNNLCLLIICLLNFQWFMFIKYFDIMSGTNLTLLELLDTVQRGSLLRKINIGPIRLKGDFLSR